VDLHLVTYFVAVVDHGGITKAAQSLYISQPSLSQAIRTLERRLGKTLFDRTGRRLVLTDDGRALEVAARRILADVDRAKEKVASVRELGSGRVEIVTYSSFSIHPMVQLVQRFRARHPGVTVVVSDADGPAGVHNALRRGEAEIGVTDLSAEHAGMITVPLLEQELVLAAHPDLAAGIPDPVTATEVREIPLVLDLGGRADAVRSGELIGEHNVVIDCAHPAATWEFVRLGSAATLAPRKVVEHWMGGAVIRSLDPPMTRPVGLVLRPGDPSPAAAAFLAAATDRAATPNTAGV
jgi:DNA-binding transcriptional LysR family regulator